MCLCACKIHEAEETHFSPASEGLRRLNASEGCGIWLCDLSGSVRVICLWDGCAVIIQQGFGE